MYQTGVCLPRVCAPAHHPHTALTTLSNVHKMDRLLRTSSARGEQRRWPGSCSLQETHCNVQCVIRVQAHCGCSSQQPCSLHEAWKCGSVLPMQLDVRARHGLHYAILRFSTVCLNTPSIYPCPAVDRSYDELSAHERIQVGGCRRRHDHAYCRVEASESGGLVHIIKCSCAVKGSMLKMLPVPHIFRDALINECLLSQPPSKQVGGTKGGITTKEGAYGGHYQGEGELKCWCAFAEACFCVK